MTTARPISSPTGSSHEKQKFLSGYWGRDLWDITDPFFIPYLARCHSTKHVLVKVLDFSHLPPGVKGEFKYFLAYKLEHQEKRLTSVLAFSPSLRILPEFFATVYPSLISLLDLAPEQALLQWRSFLAQRGIKFTSRGHLVNYHYGIILQQALAFTRDAIDPREEYEKAIWDLRKIPGSKLTSTSADYWLHFEEIPLPFLALVKRYLKVRVLQVSYTQCYLALSTLKLFLRFILQRHPTWKDLVDLSRQDIEDYLSWYGAQGHHASRQRKHFVALHVFLGYIQRAGYPEAPQLPLVLLLQKDDKPRDPQPAGEAIKYIPDTVLQQLEAQLEHLAPAEYIPVVILLRASGWRISDILHLRYDTCLERTDLGWYLRGDINKTQILNHHIPITNEVAAVVQAVIEETKGKSAPDNNPDKLLFVRVEGKRKGRSPLGEYISHALNRLAQRYQIVDQQEQVFHFGNHAFRHTKAVELINNGMSLVHVQKWLAHYSAEMTLRYAKILDTTLREEWEKVAKRGLFRFDRSGNPTRVQLSDLANEDVIEWEYIRTHLDAVRVPLGYCMKPLKMPCGSQLNPCLTCPFLCTTAQFLPEFERHLQDTQAMIDRGKALGRTVWVEKNATTFIRLESITRVLRDGKTHHKVGKQGREYTGEGQHHDQHP